MQCRRTLGIINYTSATQKTMNSQNSWLREMTSTVIPEVLQGFKIFNLRFKFANKIKTYLRIRIPSAAIHRPQKTIHIIEREPTWSEEISRNRRLIYSFLIGSICTHQGLLFSFQIRNGARYPHLSSDVVPRIVDFGSIFVRLMIRVPDTSMVFIQFQES